MTLHQKHLVIHFVEHLGKGGLENVVYQIVTRLDKTLFDVGVVCRIKGGYTADEINKQGVPVKILYKNKIPLWKINKLLKAPGTNRNAILHCHGLFSSSSEAIMGRQSGFDSIFVHVHNLEKPDTLYQRFKLRILKRTVNKFIAVSDSVHHCLLQNSIKNIQTIHNGVDINRYKFNSIPKQGEYGFSNDTFVLGMVGRIVKRKGFDHFIKIIQNIPNTSGVIVGSGSYNENVKKMISEKKLQERIKCLPFQSQEKLPNIYSSLDALFLFSEREGLPLSLLEAQSVGVPYIGNSVGGIGEVVKDGHNGFVIDKIDFEIIRDKINRIKENAIYYRSNARKVVEESYSLDKAIINIEKLYMESLEVVQRDGL